MNEYITRKRKKDFLEFFETASEIIAFEWEDGALGALGSRLLGDIMNLKFARGANVAFYRPMVKGIHEYIDKGKTDSLEEWFGRVEKISEKGIIKLRTLTDIIDAVVDEVLDLYEDELCMPE